MDNPSRLIVLTLMVMVCVFSVVLIFKGEFREYKEREVAKEKISPQKQEVAKQENIQWTPSVLPPTPIDRTPAVIAQEEKKYEEAIFIRNKIFRLERLINHPTSNVETIHELSLQIKE